MRATINIDIGGTFTDCFVTADDKVSQGKAPTTRYNIALGFRQAIEAAAGGLGLSLDELLESTDVVRYGTTISMNALIERTGPKLGFITTRGHEDILAIGRGHSCYDGLSLDETRCLATLEKPEPLIPREMVVGVRERVDYAGKVVMPLQREEVLAKLQYLVDKGAMGFVVCLLWSIRNPVHEQMIKQIIQEEYPDTYLGNMPVILSSELIASRGEYPRANTTVLSAYMHADLADELHALGEELRQRGYKRSVLAVQNTGGTASVARTAAVNTYGSGPVAGLFGGTRICQVYGIDNAVVSDMGGTSFDFGLLVDKRPRFYETLPVIERYRTSIPMLQVSTIGAGGGSIAWIDPYVRRIRVGPKSAGSMPGPACYDQGGTEPTVTDADVVLGYINPDYFLGGSIPLSKDLAVKTIKEKIADPLGITVPEAAWSIKTIVDGTMGNEMFKEVALKGYDPREFVVFAYGGAGPTHCCGYASYLGNAKIYLFPFSPVFCAFGASSMNVMHVYDMARHIVLMKTKGGPLLSEYEEFNAIVAELKKRAIADMKGEGFNDSQIAFEMELGMHYGAQLFTVVVQSPCLLVKDDQDVTAICDAFEKTYAAAYSAMSAYPEGGIEVEVFRLKVVAEMPRYQFPVFASGGKSSKHAVKATRDVYWDGGFKKTPIYESGLLKCGNVVEGPAVIEASDTTTVVPAGKQYVVDQYLNAFIESVK